MVLWTEDNPVPDIFKRQREAEEKEQLLIQSIADEVIEVLIAHNATYSEVLRVLYCVEERIKNECAFRRKVKNG